MAQVKLTSRGESYNGQNVEEGEWECVGPGEYAKVTEGFVLWVVPRDSVVDFKVEEWKKNYNIANWLLEVEDGQDALAVGQAAAEAQLALWRKTFPGNLVDNPNAIRDMLERLAAQEAREASE